MVWKNPRAYHPTCPMCQEAKTQGKTVRRTGHPSCRRCGILIGPEHIVKENCTCGGGFLIGTTQAVQLLACFVLRLRLEEGDPDLLAAADGTLTPELEAWIDAADINPEAFVYQLRKYLGAKKVQ